MRNLELTYRRLLLAYPRSYRRERGLEILTTLMDAAESGRRPPSTRDALNVVLSGLRFRFSPPRGWRHWLVAGLTSVFIGLLLATTAAAWAWAWSPTVPSTAARLVELPPSENTAAIRTHDFLGKNTPARQEGWPGVQPAPDSIMHVYRPETLDEALLGLYQRMPRDGWRTGELIELEDGYVFWASRDGVMVRVQGLRLDGSTPSISVRTHLAEPAVVTPVAIGGLALGTIAGWLLACGLMRRARRIRPGWQATAAVFAVISLAAQGVLVMLMLGGLAILLSSWGPAQFHWLAPLDTLQGAPLFTAGAVGGLLVAAVTVLIAPTEPVGFRREPVSP